MPTSVLNDIPLGLPGATPASLLRIDTWRRTLEALDDLTRVGQEAFAGGFGNPQEAVGENPYREWYGGFRMVPSATTITVATRTTGADSGDRLRLLMNGALVTTWTLSNGDQTHTATLPALAANTAPEVVLQVARDGAGPAVTWGSYEVIGAFIGPVSLPDAYPGAPSFSTLEIPSSLTVQLATSINWLRRLVALRTRPLFQSAIRVGGPFEGQDNVRWFGGLVRSPAHPTLKAAVSVIVNAPGATEQIRLRVNGATVATYDVPGSPGEYFATLSWTIAGVSAGDRMRLEVDHIRTAGGENDQTPISRFSLYRVWAEGPTAYAALDLPVLNLDTFYPLSSIKSTLNAYAAAATTLKARIDANPDLWSRQYLFRARYGYTEEQAIDFEPAFVATRFERAGEALLVRGKGVSVAYGPAVFEGEPTHPLGFYNFENLRTQNAIGGDGVSTAIVYLDGQEGLYMGDPYNLRGPVIWYAGEITRVSP
jgi:hypothetical protein